jgi:hypothetical protein
MTSSPAEKPLKMMEMEPEMELKEREKERKERDNFAAYHA